MEMVAISDQENPPIEVTSEMKTKRYGNSQNTLNILERFYTF